MASELINHAYLMKIPAPPKKTQLLKDMVWMRKASRLVNTGNLGIVTLLERTWKLLALSPDFDLRISSMRPRQIKHVVPQCLHLPNGKTALSELRPLGKGQLKKKSKILFLFRVKRYYCHSCKSTEVSFLGFIYFKKTELA